MLVLATKFRNIRGLLTLAAMSRNLFTYMISFFFFKDTYMISVIRIMKEFKLKRHKLLIKRITSKHILFIS